MLCAVALHSQVELKDVAMSLIRPYVKGLNAISPALKRYLEIQIYELGLVQLFNFAKYRNVLMMELSLSNMSSFAMCQICDGQ